MLLVGTRAALAAGIGLLLSNRLNNDQRKAAGWALVLVGGLTHDSAGNGSTKQEEFGLVRLYQRSLVPRVLSISKPVLFLERNGYARSHRFCAASPTMPKTREGYKKHVSTGVDDSTTGVTLQAGPSSKSMRGNCLIH